MRISIRIREKSITGDCSFSSTRLPVTFSCLWRLKLHSHPAKGCSLFASPDILLHTWAQPPTLRPPNENDDDDDGHLIGWSSIELDEVSSQCFIGRQAQSAGALIDSLRELLIVQTVACVSRWPISLSGASSLSGSNCLRPAGLLALQVSGWQDQRAEPPWQLSHRRAGRFIIGLWVGQTVCVLSLRTQQQVFLMSLG